VGGGGWLSVAGRESKVLLVQGKKRGIIGLLRAVGKHHEETKKKKKKHRGKGTSGDLQRNSSVRGVVEKKGRTALEADIFQNVTYGGERTATPGLGRGKRTLGG